MARTSLMSQAERAVESSPWSIPGALLGAYALTRLPFGMLAGLALGFAAGWTLRGELEGRPRREMATDRGTAGETRRAAAHAKEEEERVDEMSDDSFPASDPPSYTATRTGKPSKT